MASDHYDTIIIGARHTPYKKKPLCSQGLTLVDL